MNARPFILMMLTTVGWVGEPVDVIAAAPPDGVVDVLQVLI